jgi:hypothetical protein
MQNFIEWMRLFEEQKFQGTAIVKYGPGIKVVANIDQNISNYYRSLIPKYYNVKPQMYPAHITIVRLNKEKPTKMENWGKHEGKKIYFEYDTDVQRDDKYFWINAYSEDIGDIREELGLPRYRDDSLFGGVKRNEYHITIGNVK